jgi:hypothetical protein
MPNQKKALLYTLKYVMNDYAFFFVYIETHNRLGNVGVLQCARFHLDENSKSSRKKSMFHILPR